MAKQVQNMQKIRICLRSFDYCVLDSSVKEIVNTATRSGAIVRGPIPMPVRRRRYDLLRSPHKDKTSREQIEIREYARLLDIIDLTSKTTRSLMSLDLPAGVDVQLKVSNLRERLREERMSNGAMLGLIGKKVGMTRIFLDDGVSLPVTVVDVSNNRIAQIRNPARDGYSALQLAWGERRSKHINRASANHLAACSAGAARRLKERRVSDEVSAQYQSGDVVSCDQVFSAGQIVDVTGVSKGKGFTGVIKRHNFSGNRRSHGNSRAHRKPGSIGMCQDPGRVFRGKKMAGQMGAKQCTVQNMQIVRVDADRQLLFIKGALPGAAGVESLVISPGVKSTSPAGA